MAIDLTSLSIASARTGLDDGAFSAQELAEAYLKEIEKKNPDIRAYLGVFDDVEAQAAAAGKKIKAGKATALTGIPLALKDNILVKGKEVTAASKILEGYIAAYDATAVSKLKEEGAVLVGRTNMDEFAMGGSTENSAFGATKNPHDTSRVPGGSSGGSAAAVAMDGALAALGSDTGGSVRQPGSFCGVVGLKPTYGAISRFGLMAMGSSLDQIGPLTKTVADAEILFRAIAGKDPNDSTSLSLSQETEEWQPLTIGVPEEFIYREGVDDTVQANFRETLKRLESLGHTIKPITLPVLSASLATYYIIMPAEASTNLARFDGVRYGPRAVGEILLEDYKHTRALFGAEVRRRILLGTYVLSAGYYDAYYGKATLVREKIRSNFREAFSGVHVVVTPTAPGPAFRIGEKSADPLSMYAADMFTVPASLAGIPALSVPSGVTEQEGKKLPLGFQIMAPWQREPLVFMLGKDVEKVRK